MDESFLKFLEHATLRQFLIGLSGLAVLMLVWIAIVAVLWRKAIRWARRPVPKSGITINATGAEEAGRSLRRIRDWRPGDKSIVDPVPEKPETITSLRP